MQHHRVVQGRHCWGRTMLRMPLPLEVPYGMLAQTTRTCPVPHQPLSSSAHPHPSCHPRIFIPRLCRYPHFPEGLSPHRVLEYPDFSSEEPAINFKYATTDTFFPKLKTLYKPWIRFSGGAPAILNPADPTTFLAVGHAQGNNNCFHKPLPMESNHRRRLLGDDKPNLYDHGCKHASNHEDFKQDWGLIWGHYWRHEYVHYLYTFSATPPHELKGISNAFVLYDAPTHSGVQFATGLTVKGDFLYMTYGKDDYRSMLAIWPVSMAQEYIVPLDKLDPDAYQFCAVGREVPRTQLMAE